MENKNDSESILGSLFNKDDPLFNMASRIADDVIRGKHHQVHRESQGSPKTAFGDLINVHQKQILLISKTYEGELVSLSGRVDDLVSAIEGANKIIAHIGAEKDELEATNENLQELLGKYQEKCNEKKDKKKENGAKKPKPKVPK